MTLETLQNLQTAEKSRGWLRFGRKFDGIDRSDENYHFKIFVGSFLGKTARKLRESVVAGVGGSDASPLRRRRKIKNAKNKRAVGSTKAENVDFWSYRPEEGCI